MHTARTMLPLAAWPLADRQNIIGVFTDIDDTLTTDGAITSDALQALADLKAAGLHVVAITGRPVGWSEPFARLWPVDAIVAENGAVALIPVISSDDEHENSLFPRGNKHCLLSKIYLQDAVVRADHFVRMQAVAARILREVPGAQLATDTPGRETDIAIDHSEFSHLPPEAIAQAVHIMQSEGMTATVSSIHINGWFGEHNKWVGARWIVRERWGRDLDAESDRWAYVGDSTNDQVMFKVLANSVGVANVARFAPELTHRPRFITPAERGRGFAQAAQAVLAAQRP